MSARYQQKLLGGTSISCVALNICTIRRGGPVNVQVQPCTYRTDKPFSISCIFQVPTLCTGIVFLPLLYISPWNGRSVCNIQSFTRTNINNVILASSCRNKAEFLCSSSIGCIQLYICSIFRTGTIDIHYFIGIQCTYNCVHTFRNQIFHFLQVKLLCRRTISSIHLNVRTIDCRCAIHIQIQPIALRTQKISAIFTFFKVPLLRCRIIAGILPYIGSRC